MQFQSEKIMSRRMTDATRNEDIFTLTFVYCTECVVCVACVCLCVSVVLLLLLYCVLVCRCLYGVRPPCALDNVLNAHTNPLRSIQTEANTPSNRQRELLQICVFLT